MSAPAATLSDIPFDSLSFILSLLSPTGHWNLRCCSIRLWERVWTYSLRKMRIRLNLRKISLFNATKFLLEADPTLSFRELTVSYSFIENLTPLLSFTNLTALNLDGACNSETFQQIEPLPLQSLGVAGHYAFPRVDLLSGHTLLTSLRISLIAKANQVLRISQLTNLRSVQIHRDVKFKEGESLHPGNWPSAFAPLHHLESLDIGHFLFSKSSQLQDLVQSMHPCLTRLSVVRGRVGETKYGFPLQAIIHCTGLRCLEMGSVDDNHLSYLSHFLCLQTLMCKSFNTLSFLFMSCRSQNRF